VRVHVCGARGSTPAPGADFVRYGGHTSCLAITHRDERLPTLVLDAGTGVRTVSSLLDGGPFAGAILLTHVHWDHFQGLPFFSAADREDARTAVFVPEQPDGTGALSLLARVMSPPHYPVRPDELRGSWSFEALAPGVWQGGGFEVLAREIPHKGGRAYGYRVSDGQGTVAYIPDHCPTTLGPGPDGLGEYHPSAVELAAGADLLVHDAQLLPQELCERADFGHCSYEYPIELARRAGTRSVMLFHHAPERTDSALDELAQVLPRDLEVTLAVQGTAHEL
jgi:ribonuclease BN (tRNA processing enzyme)